jgi:hypothetical protein
MKRETNRAIKPVLQPLTRSGFAPPPIPCRRYFIDRSGYSGTLALANELLGNPI